MRRSQNNKNDRKKSARKERGVTDSRKPTFSEIHANGQDLALHLFSENPFDQFRGGLAAIPIVAKQILIVFWQRHQFTMLAKRREGGREEQK